MNREIYPDEMKEYETYIQNILNDAIKHIFSINIKTKYIDEFSRDTYEEHSQLDVKKFLTTLCANDPPKQFNIYSYDNDCNEKKNPIMTSCSNI